MITGRSPGPSVPWWLARGHWPAVALVLLAFWLMVSSMVLKSPTVDEQSHLFRGIAYLKTGATQFLLGHPLLGSTIAALPLLTETDLQLPLDHPAWAEGNWSTAGDQFMWQIGNDPHRIIFLGRLPVVWLTLLLGALVIRWGRELAGAAAGVMAGVFVLLDPNVLAHGRLITGDLPLVFFFALTIYGFWRWSRGSRLSGGRSLAPLGPLFLAGLGLGLAGATKFNAALLVPILGLLGAWLAWRRRSWRPLLAVFAAGLLAWAVIWLVNGLAIRPLPGGAFWDDLLWQFRYFERDHGAYLAGRYSADGWWYYFPVAFLVKTPLPTLALMVAAVVTAVFMAPRLGQRYRTSLPFLLLPPAVYFAFSLTSDLNIGYRHLLPMLPFLVLFSTTTLAGAVQLARPRGLITGRRLAWLLPLALALTTLWNWPDYIPFFNVLAGGSQNGWRILSDSNVDWGQDLPALAEWQKADGRPLLFSYFGTAHPSAYDLVFSSLPTWPPGPEQQLPQRQPFYPPDPAPGLYAISVTNLHGMVLGQERDTFDYFRSQEPVDRVGGSIFLYDVPANGPAVRLGLAGLTPAALPPELFEWLASNDLRPVWFDGRTSLWWPVDDQGWWAASDQQPPDPALAGYWPDQPLAEQDGLHLYRPADQPQWEDWNGPAGPAGPYANFLGYQRLDSPPGEVLLFTAWQAQSPTDRPLKIFVHALDDQGQILGQWDGLDVDPNGWHAGDIFIQLHRFSMPDAAVAFDLATGMYDGETLNRFTKPIFLEE